MGCWSIDNNVNVDKKRPLSYIGTYENARMLFFLLIYFSTFCTSDHLSLTGKDASATIIMAYFVIKVQVTA